MKKIIILGTFFAVLTITSCEKTNVNEEIFEEEMQLVDPDDDGTIDEDDHREGE